MPMDDDELAKYLGIADIAPEKRAKFIASIPPERRRLYERMKQVEIEAALWAQGLGPKPQGVLIDTERSTRRRRAWR
jgi:hypothetical protein